MKNKFLKSLILITGLLVMGAASWQTYGQSSYSQSSSSAETKYTCPVHPEVIQDRPGTCPKCGRTLVMAQGNSGGSMNRTSDSTKYMRNSNTRPNSNTNSNFNRTKRDSTSTKSNRMMRDSSSTGKHKTM